MTHDCPFCYFTSDDDGQLYDHAISHRGSNGNSVTMIIEGVRYTLTKARGEDAFYLCPLCDERGSMGGIWAHFTEKHNKNSTSKRPHEHSNPAPNKRQRQSDDPAPYEGLPDDSSAFDGSDAAATAAISTPPPSSSPTEASKSNDSLSSAPLDVASSPHLDLDIAPSPRLDSDVVFAQHSSSDKILHFLRVCMSNVVRTCVFHTVMLPAQHVLHDRVWKCTVGVVGQKGSEYRMLFTKSLHAVEYSVCYRCWCPMDPIFDHDYFACDGKGEAWEDWWRGVPYLVWRTKQLREVVFAFLGIPRDTFINLTDYAAWLTQAAQDPTKATSDFRITNIIAVVYAYFKLVKEGKIVKPTNGFVLDNDIPAPRF